MADRHKDEERVFRAALKLKSLAERAAYLGDACADDVALLHRVQALLRSHKGAGNFLEAPALDVSMTFADSSPSEGPGTVIGHYKLLEKIGEGGMAVVYMAEQEQPVRRKVALKVIKLGMDTKQVIARFEAERQALALMDHPNIAKVFDAGSTDTGRPYFVMELVRGVSITEYCDKNMLNPRERLDLFIQVCGAVQHAHQKGIIHRDIKPTNVMVTLHEGKPLPMVIDFGIAKATSQRLTEKTLFTRYAQMIGTPEYMSPEQAEMSRLDVDTRTDIYSLGVLLYELLTGTLPFDAEKLREAGYVEIQRIIREEEPDKPSTKLSTMGEALTDIAKHRKTNAELLPKLVRGDLDWIVMKSLEKDRTHRYDTASALALDIQRHLSDEPVLARAPKVMYRLQKFLRRHRSQTIATATIAVLIGAVIALLSMWNQNRLQLARAEMLAHESILSQARESLSNGDALAALQQIEPILSSRHVGSEAKLLYACILVEGQRPGEAMSRLGDLLHESPEVAGAAGSLMAWILWEDEPSDSEELRGLGEYRQKAQGTLEGLLDEAPETAGYASLLLARMLSEDESVDDEKLRRIDELRQGAEELLPKTAESYFFQATMALAIKDKLELLEEALAIDYGHYDSRRLRALIHYASRRYSEMQLDVEAMLVRRPQDLLGHSLRAIALRELGDYEHAIKAYDKAIECTSEADPQRAKLCDQRCQVYLRMGDYERAIENARGCLELSSDRTIFQFHIFCALTASGEFEEASKLFHQVADSALESKGRFRDLSMKYVADMLSAGRPWHPTDSVPHGVPFLAMLEAEEIYHSLRSKAEPLIPDGFAADWCHDGTRLAFSLGVPGHSGVATFDPASQETTLLIAPGTNPKWSPDGQHIAFIRDRHILPLSELTSTDRRSQSSSYRRQELWIMKQDGTEPRRLAYGRRPSWSQNSKHVYCQSLTDHTVYSISIEDRDAEPKPILPFPHGHCSVSPDERYVAYAGRGLLEIVDMASQSPFPEWKVPLGLWGGNWHPEGREFSMGGYLKSDDRTGLWIYDLEKGEAEKVLTGQITEASWAPDGTKLALSLGSPFYDIWVAGLDPNISTIEALGPGRTPEEHYQEMIEYYTLIIEADPEDAGSYFSRAQYYHYLTDQEGRDADMDKYRAILNPQKGTDGYDRWLETAGDQEGHVGLHFGTPTNLGPTVNTPAHESVPSISADGLSLYFQSNRHGGHGPWDIYVAKRATTKDEWGPAVNLGPPVNSSTIEYTPCISADGLELYFGSYRAGGRPGDIWVARRETQADPWSEPVILGSIVNSPYGDGASSISADGLTLFLLSNRPGGFGGVNAWGEPGFDIWVTTRETTKDSWSEPVILGPPVNSASAEEYPHISADGLTLFFSSGVYSSPRPGGYGGSDIWVAMRKTTDADWSEPVNLGPPVNGPFMDRAPRISADGSTLYFCSDRPGGIGTFDLWQASIIPTSALLQKDRDADVIRKLAESDSGKEG